MYSGWVILELSRQFTWNPIFLGKSSCENGLLNIDVLMWKIFFANLAQHVPLYQQFTLEDFYDQSRFSRVSVLRSKNIRISKTLCIFLYPSWSSSTKFVLTLWSSFVRFKKWNLGVIAKNISFFCQNTMILNTVCTFFCINWLL